MNRIVVTTTIDLRNNGHFNHPDQEKAKQALAYQYGWVSSVCPDDDNGFPDTGNQDHLRAFEKLIYHNHPITIECELTRHGELIPIRIL